VGVMNWTEYISWRTSDKIMMIEARTRFELSNCARKLGLVYSYFGPRYTSHLPNRCWDIVGRKVSSVEKKILELRGKDNEEIVERDKKRKCEAEAEREHRQALKGHGPCRQEQE
jgi:hypothetical protein